MRVAQTARDLAARYALDEDKAYVAGILHDIARDYSPGELLAKAAQYGIAVGIWEKYQPVVLHGPVAAAIAERDLGIRDREILEAVSVHTLGSADMSPVAKVVYLADIIEPGRRFAEAEHLRQLAEEDLDRAVLGAMDGTITYLIHRRLVVHPQTIEARNKLLVQQTEKEDGI